MPNYPQMVPPGFFQTTPIAQRLTTAGLGLDWPDMYLPERKPQIRLYEEPARPPYDPNQSPADDSFRGRMVIAGRPLPMPLAFSGDTYWPPAGTLDQTQQGITDVLSQQRRQGGLLAEGTPEFFPGLSQGQVSPNPWANSPPAMPPHQAPPGMGGNSPAVAQGMTQQQPNGRQPFEQLNQVPQNPLPQAAQMPQSQGQAQGQPGGMSNAALMGILSAGLGILANNTGHYGAAGPAIGRGGQVGLGTYLQQSQLEVENKRRDALAKAEEERWQQQAEYNRQLGGIAVASEGRAAAKDQAAAAMREKNQRLMSEYQMASPDRKNQIVRELTMESKPEEILKLEHGAKNSAFNEKVSALTHSLGQLPMSSEARTMLAEGIVAGRFVESRDPMTGAATIIDLGKQGSGGGAGVGGGYGGGQAQATNAPATAVDPSLDASLGTGGTGFFQGWANKIAGVVDYPLPYPDTDKAINALTNMQVQTTAKLQEAVPGRPSNMLMSQLKELTVTPGSLFQGDEASFNKLTQTRAMLATELSRMEREILSGATPVKPEELSKTRVNHSELRQLLAEYDALLKNFGAYKKKKTPEELLDDIKRRK